MVLFLAEMCLHQLGLALIFIALWQAFYHTGLTPLTAIMKDLKYTIDITAYKLNVLLHLITFQLHK